MHTHIHTHNGVLLRNKDEILSFSVTQVDLENIMLNEISQTMTNTICLIYRILFYFFFFLNFIFKLYIIVLVLPNIKNTNEAIYKTELTYKYRKLT